MQWGDVCSSMRSCEPCLHVCGAQQVVRTDRWAERALPGLRHHSWLYAACEHNLRCCSLTDYRRCLTDYRRCLPSLSSITFKEHRFTGPHLNM